MTSNYEWTSNMIESEGTSSPPFLGSFFCGSLAPPLACP